MPELTHAQRVQILCALQKGEGEECTPEEVHALLCRELAQPDDVLDTQLIDACCLLLCTLHGRDDLCAAQTPERTWTPPGQRPFKDPSFFPSVARRAARFAVRVAAVAACITVLALFVDFEKTRRFIRIDQSEDEQQALVGFGQKEDGVIPHADANDTDLFDSVYTAVSLDDLWAHAGYTLPLPGALPADMQAVRAYIVPFGSVDVIHVLYEGAQDAALCVDYWYDASRENLLLGYERWTQRRDTVLANGQSVLRFPDMEGPEKRRGVFIRPHITCSLEAKGMSEASFVAALESMDVIERGDPPASVTALASDPLAGQPRVTDLSTPILHFYTLADMDACTRMAFPMPAYIPDGVTFDQGHYMHNTDMDAVSLRYEGEGDAYLSIDYDVYNAVTDYAVMGYEQNEEGRRVLLGNGLEAYIAYNYDIVFALITGKRSTLSIHLGGYDEATLLQMLHSLPALPSGF